MRRSSVALILSSALLALPSGGDPANERLVTVYFIRHAQSKSNALTSATTGLGLKNLVTPGEDIRDYTTRLFPFTDAPLSAYGHSQARRLGTYYFQSRGGVHVSKLITDNDVVIGVSNLARTHQTMANFLRQRKRPGVVTIEILNCLQESDENQFARLAEDRMTDVTKSVVPKLRQDPNEFQWKFGPGISEIVDYNKKGEVVPMETRFKEFMEWLRAHAYGAQPVDTFLVAGHSGWLKEYITHCLGIQHRNVLEEQMLETKLGNASMVKISVRLVPNFKDEVVPGKTCLVVEVDESLSKGVYRKRKAAQGLVRASRLSQMFRDSRVGRLFMSGWNDEYQKRKDIKDELRLAVKKELYCTSPEEPARGKWEDRSVSVSTENSDASNDSE
jgi:broad specificity phosphatase PhoE